MEKQRNKTGYELLAAVGLGAGVVFLSEIGMHYDNIGSRTGVVLSALLILYSCLKLKSTPLTKAEQLFLDVGLPVGILLAAVVIVTTGYMIFGIPNTKPNGTETVVILGSGVNADGSPSAVMQKRVDAAVSYLNSHENETIIVSGGQLGTSPISEAESMKQALIQAGIKEDRIICEDQSRTTRENLQFTAKLMEENNLGKDIVLVTSEFHLARACEFARRNGLNPVPVRAETPWYSLPAYAVREMYAIIECYVNR